MRRSSPRRRPTRCTTTSRSSLNSPTWQPPGDPMRGLKILLLTLVAVTVLGFLPLFPRQEKTSDYDRDLARIASDLAGPPKPGSPPVDAALRRAGLLYRRASLTGDFAQFQVAEKAIDEAFAAVGPSEDLVLLRAQFNFKLHRLKSAAADVQALAAGGESSGLLALEA